MASAWRNAGGRGSWGGARAHGFAASGAGRVFHAADQGHAANVASARRGHFAAAAAGAPAGPHGYTAVPTTEDDCCSPPCGFIPEPCQDACCEGSGCEGGANVMSYVGPGGDYVLQQTFRFIGRGAGQWGLVTMPQRGPSCVVCTGLCALPLLLLLLAWWLLVPAVDTSTTTVAPIQAPFLPTPELVSSKLSYDCSMAAQRTWTTGKRAWCCEKVGKGCPTTPPPQQQQPPPPPPLPPPPPPPLAPPAPTTTPCPIDCNAGYNDLDPLQWVRGWSGAKKLWCCRHAGRGCPVELPPPSGQPPSGLPPEPDTSTYDCGAGYHECMHCIRAAWSPAKIAYCCRVEHKACAGTIPE